MRFNYHKYHAKKTEVDGIKFDSKKEANRYLFLKEEERKGRISSLELQPSFELQQNFKHNGKTVRAVKYVADFQYKQDGKLIVEDVKGFKTPVYNLKKKVFLFQFGYSLEFREV